MRKRISEKNIFPKFSVKEEHEKLQVIFRDYTSFGLLVGPLKDSRARPSLSYEECMKMMFLDWKLRGTYTSYEEMVSDFQISDEDFEVEPTEDQLLDYIQFILNAVLFVNAEVASRKYTIYKVNDTYSEAITNNSLSILSKLNAELKVDRHTNELYVVYKDDVASAMAEKSPELADSIMDYLKIDNRSDLKRKGEILCTLAKALEPKENILNGTEFNKLCADTTFLLNHIGARHYQDPDRKDNAPFLAMSDSELEKWYDHAFDMFLACMSALPYLEYKKDIKTLKSGDNPS